MSHESAQKLVAKLYSDESFRNELKNAADDAARKAIATKHGFDCTRAEVEAHLPGGGGAGEISEADLEAVAGGGGAKASAVLSAAVSAAALA